MLCDFGLELSDELLYFLEVGLGDLVDLPLEDVLEVVELLEGGLDLLHELGLDEHELVLVLVDLLLELFLASKSYRVLAPLGVVVVDVLEDLLLEVVEVPEDLDGLLLRLVLAELDGLHELLGVVDLDLVLGDDRLLQLVHDLLDLFLELADLVLHALQTLDPVQVPVLSQVFRQVVDQVHP